MKLKLHQLTPPTQNLFVITELIAYLETLGNVREEKIREDKLSSFAEINS